MTLASTKGIFLTPTFYLYNTTASNSNSMDADAHLVSNVYQVYKAGNIRNVWVYPYGTITTTDSIKISIQGVSSGNPDGTIKGTGNNGYVNVDCEAIVTAQWNGPYQLGADVAVTQGEFISIVIQYVSYTSGKIDIGYGTPALVPWSNYGCVDLGAGSWTKSSNINGICFEYDDGTYAQQSTVPACAAVAINTGSNPNAIGNYLKFPYPFRAVGIWYYGDFDYDATLQLQDASGNVLANCTHDADNRVTTSLGTNYIYFDSDPASTYNIAKDTYYRVVVLPSDANSISPRAWTVPEAAAMDGLDLGTYCIYTARTDTTWSETDTKRTMIGLIGDQLDNGAGGGRPEFRGGNL